jgi:hypothetical protein
MVSFFYVNKNHMVDHLIREAAKKAILILIIVNIDNHVFYAMSVF